MLWKVTDDWMDKEIKAKGISMGKRRDFAWDLITEYVLMALQNILKYQTRL